MDTKTLKRVQKIQYNMLKEIDMLCKKHDIKYILFGGTLLGAIRHKGFIPWDDDIDIAMLRDDYEKFILVAEKELNPKLFLQTYKTDKKGITSYIKIRKNNTLFLEKANKNLNIHHGIFIDIFPMDNYIICDRKANGIIKQIKFFSTLKNVIHGKYVFNKKNILKSTISLFLKLLKFIPSFYFNQRIDHLAKKFNNLESNLVNHFTNGISKERLDRFFMEKNDFSDTMNVFFEEDYFPIPKKYNEILTRCYGEYMTIPPLEKQKPSHAINVLFDVFNAKLN